MLKKILKRIKNWLNPPLAMAPRFTDQVNEALANMHNDAFNREYDVQQERYEPTVLTNVAGTMIVNPGTHAQPQDTLPVTLTPGEMIVPHLGIGAGAALYNQQTQGIGLLGQSQGQLNQQAPVLQQAQHQWNPQVYYAVSNYQIPQQEQAAPITPQTELNWGHPTYTYTGLGGGGQLQNQYTFTFEDVVIRAVPVAPIRKKRKLNLPDWF